MIGAVESDAEATPSRVLVALHVEAHSGPQRSLRPRLEWLAERGARIATLVPAPGPAVDLAAEVGEVRIGGPGALLVPRGFGTAARLPALLRGQARALASAVRATDAEVAIVTSALMPGALAGARRGGAGVVLYSGEILAGAGPRGLAAAAIARHAGRRADSILGCSEAVAEAYRRRGVEAAVLYPPIEAPGEPRELAERGAAMRRRLGVDPGERLVCSMGAITAARGQDTLVEALAAAVVRGVRWRLAIGGEPYARAADLEFARRLDELIERRGLSDQVILAGRIEDPSALYAAADAFANPARFAEPFGRAACEALAAGCPVVSTRVGGAVEALSDGATALLVEPDAPVALAAAIERVLDDRPLAERLVAEGREDVARRFAPAVGEPVFAAAVRAALAARRARSSKAGMPGE